MCSCSRSATGAPKTVPSITKQEQDVVPEKGSIPSTLGGDVHLILKTEEGNTADCVSGQFVNTTR